MKKNNNKINAFKVYEGNNTDYETPAFQILDILGNTDPKYSEIEIAEKLIVEFPHLHSFLNRIVTT